MNTSTNLKKQYPFVKYSIWLSPMLIFITLLSLGGGHGTGFFFKLFFPYSIIMGVLFSESGPDVRDTILIIGFLLYIFYGITLKTAQQRNRLRGVIMMLCITHLAMSLICFIFLP